MVGALMDRLEAWVGRRVEARNLSSAPQTVSVSDLSPYASLQRQVDSIFDGSKFPGGFDVAKIFTLDFRELQRKSVQLFHENIYARGLIRRLITNEINTGLVYEATPISGLLPLDEDELNDWSDIAETRFQIWANNPKLCDYQELHTFGKLQQIARMNALISGDVLQVLRYNRVTGLPSLQLISGESIQTPIDYIPREGNRIVDGVEIDGRGRHIAFYVIQPDYSSRRIPAFGERSKRRLAWLSYGTEKLIGGVRGAPFLYLSLQALKEIDRIKDATQRTAVIQASIAMIIKKSEAKPGTRPMLGAATRRDGVPVTDGDGGKRNLNFTSQLPGLIIDELAQGEEPVAFETARTGVNFQEIESVLVHSLAWGNEIPPEVLMLAFSRNYAGSRSAINEFKMYLERSRMDRKNETCRPIQAEWLISEILEGRISAPGFLGAWRDPLQFDVFGAWCASEWMGAIKPSADLLKDVKAYEKLNEKGWITGLQASRELTNTRFDQNIRRIKKENKAWADAYEPILRLKQKLGEGGNADILETIESNQSVLDEIIENVN